MNLTGAHTALITPFNEDESIDYAALEGLIEHQIQNGISGLIILGTTGENPTITDDERQELMEFVVAKVNKRVPIVMGTGTNSTRQTIAYSQAAEKAGCDALLVVTPYYNKPTQAGLYAHFKAVAESVKLPIILYNVPSRTSRNIETDTVVKLAQIDNIIGVKEASGDMNQIRDVIKRTPDGFLVLSGDDGIAYEVVKAGGHGVVSVITNALPQEMSNLIAAALRKDDETAQMWQDRMAPLFDYCFIETNPQPIKAMCNYYGLCKNEFRLPMIKMSSEAITKLINDWTEVTDKFDLLSVSNSAQV